MIDFRSRKARIAAQAFVVVILLLALPRLGVELSDAELQTAAAAVVTIALGLIGGTAVEDHGRHAAGTPPVPPAQP